MNTNASLKRSLSLPVVTFYGVGAILGAGIYVLIGEVAGVAGYYAPFSFLLAAIIAVFSAFSYAELSARYPQSAGEAVYIGKAFGKPKLTRVVGLMVVLTGIVSAATMATGVVGYVQLFWELPPFIIIAVFVVAIGLVALWGINESASVVVFITLIEVLGLAYVCYVASDQLDQFPLAKVLSGEDFGRTDVSVQSGLFLGAFLAFYAYIGFEDMVNVAEEVKQPEQTLPKAIILALCISTGIYMAVSYSALSVLSPTELVASRAPLASVVEQQGQSTTWIGLVSMVAVVNGAIVQLIMASRVIYGLAKTQLLPVKLSQIYARTATPVYATVLCIVLTLLLALIFPLGALAQATSFIVLLIFTLVNVALLRIKLKKIPTNTVQYPFWVPCVGVVMSGFALSIKLVWWL
jgi:amino acid transporter